MSSNAILLKIQQEFKVIKQSSTIIRSLIDTSSYGLALISADYHVIEINSTMREWFPGIDVSRFPFCYSCFHSASGSACPDCPAQESIRTGTKHKKIMEFPADGRDFVSYKVSCTPLPGPDGQIWGVLAVVEDVSEEVRKERDLQELQLQYRQTMENASDAIITFDRHGTILQTNKKVHQLFGYSERDIRNMPVYRLIPEKRRDEQQKALETIFANRQTSEMAVQGQCLKKDGTTLDVEITYSLVETSRGDTMTAIIRDISERKSYEKQLRTYAEELEFKVEARTQQLIQSENRYRTLVETAYDAIISTDRQGNIIYFNKKAEELYNYKRAHILGQNILTIAPQEILDAIHREIKHKNSAATGNIMESCGITRDGTRFPVECTISTFERDGEQNLTLIVRDRTIRKKLEQELQHYTAQLEGKVRERTCELTASQQELKNKVAELSILNEISEALSSAMELDDVINIILVGATSHHGLGFNRAFLFLLSDDGRHLEGRIAIGPSNSSEAQKIWGEILGKNLTLREILQTYKNTAGQIDTHVNKIVKSIRIPLQQENHILTQAVKNRESFNIKDGSAHPLVPRDLLGTMKCTAFALVPLTAKSSVLGVLWADNAITKNAIDDRALESLQAFALNASLAIEKSHLYENIQEKVIELDRANKELKENRDRLIRSEKLAAVGEMSATVAHGIRNPLVSIGGFARRMLKKEKEDSTNKKYLEIIVEEINRLETILSELLDFVRPKKLNLQQVNPHAVIEATLQLVDLELRKKGITVEKHFMPDPPALDIDPDQFKRVLHNLFNNAMEAMPGGGVLSVGTTREEGKVRISIADTGSGIADNDIEKIFHPFFTSKPTGSGLGLAVCNQIISIHGGHIKLIRQIPHGAVFNIYLPLTKQ